MSRFFASLTRHPLSLLGAALTTASAVVILAIFLFGLAGFEGGPYSGILAYLVLPGFFVLGLAMIPIGLRLQRRREAIAAAGGAPVKGLPVIDLNVPRVRRSFLTFTGLTVANVMILGLVGYKGIETLDSTPFCGQACHSVMDPEFTAYSRSPHARVHCVDCHIGPGADWFVKSKLSGAWQVVSVNLNLYPRPIPTPVHNLRPARETCEQCHWPEKFVGDRLRVRTHYDEDEANTEKKSVLLVKVGGLKRQDDVAGSISQGIHWHIDRNIQIRYLSDESRENIYEVEMKRADGSIEKYAREKKPEAGEKTEWRTMDCVDCHNRPTHIYRLPQNELDAAIEVGKIDRSLPFIKREGMKALQVDYPSHEAAKKGIAQQIAAFYAASYPEVARSKQAQVEAAGKELGFIYSVNVFPSMNIKWGTYPNHIGHQDFPGCFRCHDDELKSASGRKIEQDCTQCHSLLAMEEENPEILAQLNP